MAGKIRVLVVDDSMFFRATLRKELSVDTDIEVVGEAYDPYDARDKILELEPDLMTLDIEMPYMSGLEFLKVLLPQWPIPVIVVSSATQYESACMAAGAMDFLAKPAIRTQDSFGQFSKELMCRIKETASKAKRGYRAPAAAAPPITKSGFTGVIALGASTGGTQSTGKILRALPAGMPGIVIVQHMPPDFTRMYAENLDKDCALEIREAKDGDLVQKGTVLIAPGGDRHIELITRGSGYAVRLTHGDKVNGHCPSVDVLFRSVAKVAGDNAVGVILTGMGCDGALGMLEMKKRGAFTIGQDEKTCVVYGMPKEAYDIGAVKRQLPLDNIAAALIAYAKDRRQ